MAGSETSAEAFIHQHSIWMQLQGESDRLRFTRV